MDVNRYINEVKEKLKMQGYAGKRITYNEFIELYKQYGNGMSELSFGQDVLEMTYSQCKDLKNQKHRATILSDSLKEIIETDCKNIKKQLALKGYIGKSIDYNELQNLHRLYGMHIQEKKFAKYVLDITDASYIKIKSGNHKAVILKSVKGNDSIDNIKDLLIKDGYAGKTIDYEELKALHKRYCENLTEKRFAMDVLELKYNQYQNIKYKNAKETIISKSNNLEIQLVIDKIKQELANKGYAGKKIDYLEFKQLYKIYGAQMQENRFAEDILEIPYYSYKKIKSKGNRTTILKSLVKEMTEDEILKLKEKLKNEGKAGKSIDYDELHSIYQIYGANMPEYLFAQKILEISNDSYRNIKNNRSLRAVMLKSLKEKISQEEIKKVQKLLEAKGYAGKFITYSQLKSLNRIYAPKISEAIFAEDILEIPYSTYQDLKRHKKEETKVLHNDRTIVLVRDMLLSDSRWYVKEELEKICNDNSISIEKLIRQVLGDGTDKYNEAYKTVLNEKGKIWIGRTKTSAEFTNKNIRKITSIARRALRDIKRKYNLKYNSEDDDFIQDAILWLSENAGDVEKNFSDHPDFMRRKMYNTMKRVMLVELFNKYIKVYLKKVSMNKQYFPNKSKKEMQDFIPSEYNLEDDVIQRIEDNQESTNFDYTQCIEKMRLQVEAGISKREILENVQQEFGISPRKLLEIMDDYLLKNGKIELNTGESISLDDR